MPPRVFIPSILSGLLLWPAFFPLDLGPVAFFALAPFLTLVRAEGVNPWRLYGAAFVGGLTFFVVALHWVRVAHPMMAMAWIGLAIMCSCYWPLGLFLLRRIDRRWTPTLAIAAPVCWVAVEYVRAHFPTGFPALKLLGLYRPTGFSWYFLGHALHGWTPFIQISDVTGAYGVSFAVAAVNGACAEWLLRLNVTRKWLLGLPADERTRGWTRAFRSTAVAAGLVALPLCYGYYSIVHPAYEKGPRVAALQADIPQNEKDGDVVNTVRRYDTLCTNASAKADLVVWPETCFTVGWFDVRGAGTMANAPAEHTKEAEGIKIWLTRKLTSPVGWKAPVLLGASSYDWDGSKEVRANSAILLDRDGTPQGRYDKIHLVPFGEFVPFRETLPVLKKLTPYGDAEVSNVPGTAHTRFPLMVGDRQYTFGVVICYEGSDATMCLPYVRKTADGDPVDFLVNISNDGWFLGTEQHELHLATYQFRAVETRRSVVRAVNMGISAIIDPDGRVIALPGDDWKSSKRIDGTVTDKVPLGTKLTWYAKLGDWFPITCWLTIVVMWYLAMPRK
jgi:apolipoprotein N-acyltransferase